MYDVKNEGAAKVSSLSVEYQRYIEAILQALLIFDSQCNTET